MFYARSYELSTGEFTNMDRPFKCSQWNSGKCAIEFAWNAYFLGGMSIVDTDYDDFEIRFSKANIAGVDWMEAVWIGAREPHKFGTPGWNLWYKKVQLALLKYLPMFDMRRLGWIEHDKEKCKYQLNATEST